MKAETIERMRAQFTARLAVTGAARGFRAEKKPAAHDLYIYDVIGRDPWTGEGVTESDVASALSDAAGKPLNIFINTIGGRIDTAKAIYSQLMRYQSAKTVFVDGLAASAGTFIAMAGDRIVTGSTASWMIHEAIGGAYGFAEDLEDTAAVLRMLTNDIAGAYEKRTKNSREQLLRWMKEESWMDAATAKARGFTDEIAEDGEVAEPAAQADVPFAAALQSTASFLASNDARTVVRARTLDRLSQDRAAASRDAGRASPGQSATLRK
jgi:ATP-dependent Clp protease, protease subunit